MSGDRVRVLLVDDDAGDALIARELLADASDVRFRVEHVRSAADGVSALTENRHDVCLLDYQLGAETGLDVLRAATEGGSEVPVVFLTGSRDRRVDLEAMNAGAVEYLVKGRLQPEVLERTIRYAMARKRMMDELARKNARLAALAEERNALLGMAAHDLRNPLAVIHGYAKLLADGIDFDAAKRREIFGTLVRNSAYMRELLDDLLDLSSVEAGTLTLERRPCRPDELVRANVRSQQTLASSKSIDIEVDVEEALPPVCVDPTRFEQMMSNLLSNAVKYSEPETVVTVRVRSVDDWVAFDVEDRGVGIEPEFLDRLFDPFSKAAARGTAGEKSTGLGLAIVKRIVDAHRARIAVDSQPGEGTTFTVYLPPHEAPHEATREPTYRSA